ncbi:S46 family peptidase [Saccharicrinis sp. FJH62]|uniref:S46 family peptidase n=1 Tax=Saccharicrinis sp. FJH62 TaxID=3344657 RepID=UPI0035D50C52
MKNFLLTLVAFLLACGNYVKADEGMWMLPYIKDLNIKTMQEMGLKLDADKIYSINHSSIKDAVVIFGRGCTGEIISDKGLILTNHHCGYSAIQSHSSVEHNYLEDGYWAEEMADEIPTAGLSVKFLKNIEDVTDRVLGCVTDDMKEEKRQLKIDSVLVAIAGEVPDTLGYVPVVKPFYSGNEYYLYVYQEYPDVRFVGAPPSSIGKFGADTDNWMWPRHTGDFSMFRVYTDTLGNPASYSEQNVPMKPKYHLPLSIKGNQTGDFAMILGFPGSTDRYLTSWGIEERMDIVNMARIQVREIKQNIWLKDMQASEKVRIQYATKYAHSSNYYKNSIGMNKGLNDLHVLDTKRELENRFTNWVNQTDARKEKYGEALPLLEEGYTQRAPQNKARNYLRESLISGTEVYSFAYRARRFADIMISGNEELQRIMIDRMRADGEKFFKDYNPSTDRKVLEAMLKVYAQEISNVYYPSVYQLIKSRYKGNYAKYADKLFRKSIFVDKDRFMAFLDKPSIKILKNDLAFIGGVSVFSEYSLLTQLMKQEDFNISKGRRLFEAGLHEMEPNKEFYPDANFTMRMTYGQVEDYMARDAVHYLYYTTLQGVMEKEDPKNWEFVVPQKLKELYLTHDYGRYADKDGTMHVNFLTNNDITGGNSGSPVINANGELFGLAFDGNWEAMSGDIAFEPELQRTINVDIRYVLFIIDKYAGAERLINEMTIVE